MRSFLSLVIANLEGERFQSELTDWGGITLLLFYVGIFSYAGSVHCSTSLLRGQVPPGGLPIDPG